jgi:hypothetical protein
MARSTCTYRGAAECDACTDTATVEVRIEGTEIYDETLVVLCCTKHSALFKEDPYTTHWPVVACT